MKRTHILAGASGRRSRQLEAPSKVRERGRVIAIENPPAQAAAPVMSPVPGACAAGQTVTLTAATGATIYYTSNGSTPSPTNGTQYSSSSPIQVTATVPIIAVAVVSGGSSAIAMGTYTIDAAEVEPRLLPGFGNRKAPRLIVATIRGREEVWYLEIPSATRTAPRLGRDIPDGFRLAVRSPGVSQCECGRVASVSAWRGVPVRCDNCFITGQETGRNGFSSLGSVVAVPPAVMPSVDKRKGRGRLGC